MDYSMLSWPWTMRTSACGTSASSRSTPRANGLRSGRPSSRRTLHCRSVLKSSAPFSLRIAQTIPLLRRCRRSPSNVSKIRPSSARRRPRAWRVGWAGFSLAVWSSAWLWEVGKYENLNLETMKFRNHKNGLVEKPSVAVGWGSASSRRANPVTRVWARGHCDVNLAWEPGRFFAEANNRKLKKYKMETRRCKMKNNNVKI